MDEFFAAFLGLMLGFCFGAFMFTDPVVDLPDYHKHVDWSNGNVRVVENAQKEQFYLFELDDKVVKVKVQ